MASCRNLSDDQRNAALPGEPDMTGGNIAASVRQRLKNKALEDRTDVQLQFTRYALERLLYRLSISEHRNHFLLKGALLFDLWFDVPFRPTRDIDLLGFGLAEIPHLINVFHDLCKIEIDDGINFAADSLNATEIRGADHYPGIRMTLVGLIDGARCPVQVDVGYGDAVTPQPDDEDYPVILDDMPAPNLRVYPVYTVVSEKLEAITSLGMINTRMKDYFDLWVILRHRELDPNLLSQAFKATLQARRTEKPRGIPLGLSDSFFANQSIVSSWQAFVKRNKLQANTLEATVLELREKLAFLFG
jgi:hypothetical protein